MNSRYSILLKRDPWKVRSIRNEYKSCIRKAIKERQFMTAIFLRLNLRKAIVITIDKPKARTYDKSLFKYTMYWLKIKHWTKAEQYFGLQDFQVLARRQLQLPYPRHSSKKKSPSFIWTEMCLEVFSGWKIIIHRMKDYYLPKDIAKFVKKSQNREWMLFVQQSQCFMKFEF